MPFAGRWEVRGCVGDEEDGDGGPPLAAADDADNGAMLLKAPGWWRC